MYQGNKTIYPKFNTLGRSFVILILTIILLFTAAQFIITNYLQNPWDEPKIHTSIEKEDLYLQKILNLLLTKQNIGDEGDIQTWLDSLKAYHARFRESHAYLTEKLNTTFDDTLKAGYLASFKTIDEQLSAFIDDPSDQDLNTAIRVILDKEQFLRSSLDKIRNSFIILRSEEEKDLRNKELVIRGIVIFLVIAEFCLLILPIIGRIRHSNRKMKDMIKEMAGANEELKNREKETNRYIKEIEGLQREVREKEKKFRELVENVNDIIYEISEEGKFTYVNPAFIHKTGYSEEELLNLYYWELAIKSDQEDLRKFYYNQIKDQRESTYYEFRIKTKKGKTLWVGQNVKMFFEQGWMVKTRAVARDITSIKKARKELKEREQLYRLLSENSKDLISLHDLDASFKYVSPSVEEMLGYKQKELIGKNPAEFTHPDDLKAMGDPPQEQILKGKKVINYTYRIRKKNGEYIWVETNVKPINENSKIAGFQTSTRDITHRYKVERALQKSEQHFRKLASNSPIGIFQADENGKLTYVNNKVCEYTGLSKQKLLSEGWRKVIHEEDKNLVLGNWKKAIEKRKDFTIEFRYNKPNNEILWAIAKVICLFNDKGEPDGYLGTVSDISDRKKFEKVLIEEKEKAEEASEAKAHFLSTMSHEIRTPMNSIIGMTNILLQENPRKNQLENLKLLKFSSENMMALINDILDYNKIEAGKITLEDVSFNLKDTLQGIHNTFEMTTREKGIDIILDYDKELPETFFGDSVRITQVINNLVSNAIKFTEEGYVMIEVSSKKVKKDKHTLHFSIRDTGIGIKKDKLQIIFNRFEQAETEITPKYGGTGLGLSITKRLLEFMGSTIHVKSKPGKGSEFFFDLTLPESKEKIQYSGKPYRRSDIQTFENKPVKILLVEDNKANQLVAYKFLSGWGAEVDFAQNGFEAVEKVQNKTYDIILMDLQMPEMDGFEASKTIRDMNDNYFKDIPILALTASPAAEIRKKVRSYGINDFVSKPFNPKELNQMIVQYSSDSSLKKGSEKADLAAISKALDQYSEGDPEFKLQLTRSFINVINEFKAGFIKSLKEEDFEELRRISHFVKSTISILSLNNVPPIVDQAKTWMSNNREKKIRDQLISDMNKECKRILDGLEATVAELSH